MSSLHIFVSATLLLSAVKGLSRLYTTDFLTPFYNSLFIYYISLTSALEEVGGQCHAPAALLPSKRPGTHYIGGWMGPRANLDGCGKSLHDWDSIPRPSNRDLTKCFLHL